ncbi:MAG TPA: hypothetical protein DCY25_04825 [Bacteroidales bacterium]|nr:hypothetical protein [Bacteroidales bacterium]
MPKIKPSSVDEYIEVAPLVVREKLREIRAILRKVAPDATEMLKWGAPVFFENRILFSYSAFKTHINFTPSGPALQPFAKELSEYNTSKDSIHFPYDRPLPGMLIQNIALHRIKEVRENDAKWMY